MSPSTEFNKHLADAFCTALLLGHETEAAILRGFPSFPHHLLMEKFCEALDHGNTKLVKALHKTGLIQINDPEQSPLFHIVRRRPLINIESLVTFLSLPDADINLKDKNGFTALMIVAGRDDISAAEALPILLRHPAINVNAQNQNGITALMIMARFGNLHMMKTMLNHAPDLNVAIKDNDGKTAYDHACLWANPKTARLIQSYESV